MAQLALPTTDLTWLRRRVANFAEDRPGVYWMRNGAGRVIYVGKAKALRTRLLSYFRAQYPEDKAARILNATTDVQWKCVSSEFAALLEELREIQRHRPVFNVQMNRTRRAYLLKVTGGAAPKIVVSTRPGAQDVLHYGPLTSGGRAREAVKALADLLGLRDCALSMTIKFSEQGDLFQAPQQAACMRYELGTCTGPCAGLVSEGDYADDQSWFQPDVGGPLDSGRSVGVQNPIWAVGTSWRGIISTLPRISVIGSFSDIQNLL